MAKENPASQLGDSGSLHMLDAMAAQDGSGMSDADSPAPPCNSPTEVQQLSLSPPGVLSDESGLFQCADRSMHRAAIVTCLDQYSQVPDNCSDDPDGGCIRPDYCLTDSDCEASAACLCSSGPGSTNICVVANCRSDADCGDHECGASPGRCGYDGLYCRTDTDECHGDTDCPGGREDTCAFDGTRWSCTGLGTCE